MTAIDIICRRCGRKAPSDEFRVDHIYKLAVCKICYTEREKNLPKKSEEKTLGELMKDEPPKEEKSYEIKKSKIFDEEDEYLEKAVKKKKELLRKQRENVVKVKLLRQNKVLYPCQNCNYRFKYNLETQRPLVCPYCESKVNHDIDF